MIRATCLGLPAVTERLSHGAPTFFIRDKATFASLLLDGHHQFTFPHLICAAGPGVQTTLVAERPAAFFVPPYVGGRGWLGVRLDKKVPVSELAGFCEDAYRVIAPAKLIAELDAAR